DLEPVSGVLGNEAHVFLSPLRFRSMPPARPSGCHHATLLLTTSCQEKTAAAAPVRRRSRHLRPPARMPRAGSRGGSSACLLCPSQRDDRTGLPTAFRQEETLRGEDEGGEAVSGASAPYSSAAAGRRRHRRSGR